MKKQKERDMRIYSKLNLEKLPYNLTYDRFKELGSGISKSILSLYAFRNRSKPLVWCFSNEKRHKIFMEIFHANEEGSEIYKEEISKNIPEYSYKTIAKIIDEGLDRGYYLSLGVDGTSGKDGKVKNIRPSEELITDFLNFCLEIIRSINLKLIKGKIVK